MDQQEKPQQQEEEEWQQEELDTLAWERSRRSGKSRRGRSGSESSSRKGRIETAGSKKGRGKGGINGPEGWSTATKRSSTR
jgi:hypothetical protein|eukprot:SAG25_NODE_242_length_11160_cov_254.065546_3_plen_81_part_00